MALSMDWRMWVLTAIDEGGRFRAAAMWFGVLPSTASHWWAQ